MYRSDMELRHLRYFVVVAEELHFGRAAKRLGLSQPPLSHQIQALEQELGAVLLERTSRQVRLTRAGIVFLSRARDILASVDRAAAEALRVHSGQQGTLRVGHVATVALRLIPTAVNWHRRHHPDVTVACQMLESVPALLAMVRAGTIDLGILRLPARDDELVFKPIQSERILLAVPEVHPLAGKRSVSWASLRDEPFVYFPRSAAPEVHDFIADFLASRGFTMKVVAETSSLMNILSYVAQGMGVALTSEWVLTLNPAGVRYVELKDPPRVQTAIAYRPEAYRDLVPPFVASLEESVRSWRKSRRT